MPKYYTITEADGRVRRTLPDGSRVLAGTPGRQIPWELAVELGLVDKPEDQGGPAPVKVRKSAAKKSTAPKKDAPSDDEEAKPAPRLSNYPTKKSSR